LTIAQLRRPLFHPNPHAIEHKPHKRSKKIAFINLISQLPKGSECGVMGVRQRQASFLDKRSYDKAEAVAGNDPPRKENDRAGHVLQADAA
jgi:hypothetical protein